MHMLIHLKRREGDYFLDIADLIIIEVSEKKCILYTTKKKIVMHRTSLSTLINNLNYPYLIRCHRNFAINVRHILEIQKDRRNIWKPIFKNNFVFCCEISKTYYKDVLNLYQSFLRDTL